MSTADGEHTRPVVPRRLHPVPPAAVGTVVLGTRDGHEVPLNAQTVPVPMAWSGPGAPGALRALLVSALTADRAAKSAAPPIVMEEVLARQLFSQLPQHRRLHLVNGCLQACALAEQHLLARARSADEHLDHTETHRAGTDTAGPTPSPAHGTMLMLVRPEPHAADRLVALADSSGSDAMVVVALGELPHAACWHIDADGTPTPTPGSSRQMPAVDRLFHLTQQAAQEVLDLMHQPAAQRTPEVAGEQAGEEGTGQAAPSMIEVVSGTQDDGRREEGAPPANHDASPLSCAPTTPPLTKSPMNHGRPESLSAGQSRPVVRLEVLGPPTLRLIDGGEPIGVGLREEVREFLALLAAHPAGLRTETIAEQLQLEGSAKQNADSLALMRRSVRRVLRGATGRTDADFILVTRGHHRLDADLIATDIDAFTIAVDQAASAAAGTDRIRHLRRAVAAYSAPYADGTDYSWAEEIREMLHRKAVDAMARLADRLTDIDEALDLLDRAATFNPTNEAIYQRIIRLQLRAGRDDAAHRTLVLLTHRLTAIDAEPSPATLNLLDLARSPADSPHV